MRGNIYWTTGVGLEPEVRNRHRRGFGMCALLVVQKPGMTLFSGPVSLSKRLPFLILQFAY